MIQTSPPHRRTIRGIILPTEWDDHDNVRAVLLSGTDEEDYIVENWEAFVGLSQMLIDATGDVFRESGTRRRIRINHYDVIDILKR